MTEQRLQNAVVDYLQLQYPKALYTSTMGGLYLGKANYRQKSIIKKHYKKGVPDVLIFEPINKFNGLMLELKTLKGRASKEQLKWRNDLNERGYVSEIVYGFDDAQKVIDRYFKGLIK